jgi:hypothetical protein
VEGKKKEENNKKALEKEKKRLKLLYVKHVLHAAYVSIS